MSRNDILCAAKEWRKSVENATSLRSLLSILHAVDGSGDRTRRIFLDQLKHLTLQWVDAHILPSTSESRSFMLASHGLMLLPNDLVGRIFQFVNQMDDLFRIADVCKKFQRIVIDSSNRLFEGAKLKTSHNPFSGDNFAMYAYFVKNEHLIWLDQHKNFGPKWNNCRLMGLAEFLRHSHLLKGVAAIEISNVDWLRIRAMRIITQTSRHIRLRPHSVPTLRDFFSRFWRTMSDSTPLDVEHLDVVAQLLKQTEFSRLNFPRLKTIALIFGNFMGVKFSEEPADDAWWLPLVRTAIFKRCAAYSTHIYSILKKCTNLERIVFRNGGALTLGWGGDSSEPKLPGVEYLVIRCRNKPSASVFAGCDWTELISRTRIITLSLVVCPSFEHTCVLPTAFLRSNVWSNLRVLNVELSTPGPGEFESWGWFSEGGIRIVYDENGVVQTMRHVEPRKVKTEDKASQEGILCGIGTEPGSVLEGAWTKKVQVNLNVRFNDHKMKVDLRPIESAFTSIIGTRKLFGEAKVSVSFDWKTESTYFEIW